MFPYYQDPVSVVITQRAEVILRGRQGRSSGMSGGSFTWILDLNLSDDTTSPVVFLQMIQLPCCLFKKKKLCQMLYHQATISWWASQITSKGEEAEEKEKEELQNNDDEELLIK